MPHLGCDSHTQPRTAKLPSSPRLIELFLPALTELMDCGSTAPGIVWRARTASQGLRLGEAPQSSGSLGTGLSPLPPGQQPPGFHIPSPLQDHEHWKAQAHCIHFTEGKPEARRREGQALCTILHSPSSSPVEKKSPRKYEEEVRTAHHPQSLWKGWSSFSQSTNFREAAHHRGHFTSISHIRVLTREQRVTEAGT